jgi:hypothetical protein
LPFVVSLSIVTLMLGGKKYHTFLPLVSGPK